jgi:periplasmic divalent cation tolerance protein
MAVGDGAVLVLTTTADDATASKLARALVEENLAACVTRSAVRSVYRWETGAEAPARAGQQKLCEEEEVILLIKTSKSRAGEMEKRLLELHPYECPELVRFEPAHVGEKYLAWLLASVR